MESLYFVLVVVCISLLSGGGGGGGVAGQSTDPPPSTTEVVPDPTTDLPPDTTDPGSTSEPGYDCSTDGIFADLEFCEYYHSCQNGVHAWIKCQSNFLFDLRYMGCNYPEYTDCGNRTRPDGYPGTVTPPDPATTPGTGYQCPPEDGNYPDPGDCTAFYQCYQGIAYRQRCPFPLRFDIAQQVCNHPGFVDCGDRPVPDPRRK
ncbi:uncharacterized protein LOC110856804 [Folsomia candida]|uniref:Endochitinase n=1 Tax=Folsomia candida TaxID=158441 RepID=A0A226DJN7_FOLCA|nr:uncharacterized protein LOC110856804 [Folsomia candida]OXA45735.1 Endochitinase [Folsomia candida]